MAFHETFEEISLDALVPTARKMRDEGWRGVQMLCVNTDAGVDLTYTFSKGGEVVNYQVRSVTKDTPVPSIQSMFLGMFPFENEAHDLFGVNVDDMTLDFGGQFYQVSSSEPMTILTPEAAARKEKAKKQAAAKAAKAAKDAQDSRTAKPADAPLALIDEEIEAKVAGLPPEKAEKLRMALKAKSQAASAPAREAAKPEPKALTLEDIEAKVAGLPPEKADKLRNALMAKLKSQEKEGE